MASIFTKIIKGKIPCYKIAEDENFFAFLDINPVQKGHTLVIPKKEIDYIFNIDDKTLADMIVFAKKVAHSIQKNITCNRISMSVIGLEVPHAHIHLIPINRISDVNFNKKSKIEMLDKEFEDLAKNINSTYNTLFQ